MARIPGFHPGGPGSIPGVGAFPFFLSKFQERPTKKESYPEPHRVFLNEIMVDHSHFLLLANIPSPRGATVLGAFCQDPIPKLEPILAW